MRKSILSTFAGAGLVVALACGTGSSPPPTAASQNPTGGDGGVSGGTPICGDGAITPPETCDDGNTRSGDGCSSTCQLEPGWVCPTPGAPCASAACGDGVVAANEQCDDGNDLPFDGCYQCSKEPFCPDGACVSVCGDGLISQGEECDDGNNVSGDGCSADCKLENVPGVYCSNVTSNLPSSITVPVIFRDFKGYPEAGGHPDFEHFHCTRSSPGLVQPTLVSGTPTKPRFAQGTTSNAFCGTDGTTDGAMITSAGTFAQWYVDAPGVNRTVVGSLSLTRVGAGNTYVYDSAQTPLGNTSNTTEVGFFPLDGLSPPESWGITPPGGETPPTPGLNHDYGFTTELHNWFTYQGGEVLNFTGDDDVWVFINNRLAVDLGGVHPRQAGSITLDDATAARMGLVKGNAYEMSLFHAERHTTSSNFELTLGGFIKLTTHCASVCGDGIKAPDEACDDGPNNGKPGSGCSPDCKFLRAL